MLLGQPIRQIAYYVPDVREAAERHSKLFGSGPFFVVDSMVLSRSKHRGVERPLDHSAAIGQWGDLMIEFDQQNDEDPSIFHDLYPAGSGRYGIHHVAMIVDDLDAAVADCVKSGFEIAFDAELNGLPFVMADAISTYGHFIELYPGLPVILGIYEKVRKAAEGFDGSNLFRSFETVPA